MTEYTTTFGVKTVRRSRAKESYGDVGGRGVEAIHGVSHESHSLASAGEAQDKEMVHLLWKLRNKMCLKACLRESVNILFVGQKFGRREKGNPRGAYSGKAAKSFFVERVFCQVPRMHFGRTNVDGQMTFTGHIADRNGERAVLSAHEYMVRPKLESYIAVTHDDVPYDAWEEIWLQAQEIGLGALRSQSYGRFTVMNWEPVEYADVPKMSDEDKWMLSAEEYQEPDLDPAVKWDGEVVNTPTENGAQVSG